MDRPASTAAGTLRLAPRHPWFSPQEPLFAHAEDAIIDMCPDEHQDFTKFPGFRSLKHLRSYVERFYPDEHGPPRSLRMLYDAASALVQLGKPWQPVIQIFTVEMALLVRQTGHFPDHAIDWARIARIERNAPIPKPATKRQRRAPATTVDDDSQRRYVRDLHCDFHGWGTHASEDCRALRNSERRPWANQAERSYKDNKPAPRSPPRPPAAPYPASERSTTDTHGRERRKK